MITKPEAASLAQLLAMIRPDWQPKSIMTLIEKHHQEHELPKLARAAINAATNPNVRTPAVIFMPGAHWADPNTMTSAEQRMLKGYEAMAPADKRWGPPNPSAENPWANTEFDRALKELTNLPDAGDELLEQIKTEHPNTTHAQRVKLAAQKLGQ